MDQSPLSQNQTAVSTMPAVPVNDPAAATTQPEQVGVPAPSGYTGPWPKLGMDGGDPSGWLDSYNEE